ncbi:MAG: hypothetical protein JWO85_2658 [Candidatus Eremiobacteraeota bacterium]|nr:hypothetical protein [Candidatus Eremiobacteraeota bacterium]
MIYSLACPNDPAHVTFQCSWVLKTEESGIFDNFGQPLEIQKGDIREVVTPVWDGRPPRCATCDAMATISEARTDADADALALATTRGSRAHQVTPPPSFDEAPTVTDPGIALVEVIFDDPDDAPVFARVLGRAEDAGAHFFGEARVLPEGNLWLKVVARVNVAALGVRFGYVNEVLNEHVAEVVWNALRQVDLRGELNEASITYTSPGDAIGIERFDLVDPATPRMPLEFCPACHRPD